MFANESGMHTVSRVGTSHFPGEPAIGIFALETGGQEGGSFPGSQGRPSTGGNAVAPDCNVFRYFYAIPLLEGSMTEGEHTRHNTAVPHVFLWAVVPEAKIQQSCILTWCT